MSEKAFLDTNIVVYAFGGRKQSGPDERNEAAQRVAGLGCVVSVQVLNEFVQVCRRRANLNWDQITEALQAIKDLCGQAVPLTMETHKIAVDFSIRYGFNIYDSLILAAAQQAGCTTLYTEDMQHGQKIGSLSIVNPFQGK